MKTLFQSPLAARLLLSLMALSPLATADQVLQVNAGRGLVNVYFPDSYDPAEPLPLLVGLHG
ncbi:MAG: hypothetical protein OSB14_07790 [Planctomycetota bacterium]|nr:hypothetical protein [Planctomycetota bacterium]